MTLLLIGDAYVSGTSGDDDYDGDCDNHVGDPANGD